MDGKFKKIELYGFKSFADKHQIPFGSGITVIVGPNGCGKSNVSDSIKWVLGEQSAKQMRGNKMQDVIFCGTAKRRLMSYCEVDLTFDNKDKALFPNLDYDEVVISRKLYRSGESEYAVNKVPTLLRDILDMLRDANMAREGYSIIGQGRVSALISAKPEDRRAIFEEAAGIAKYKKRKIDAERKLAKTRDNLQRVYDILTEKHRQLEPLLKQAENAKKWLELRDKLRNLEINTFIYQHDNTSTAKDIIKTRLQGVVEQILLVQSRSEEAIAQYNKAMSDLASVDDKISALRDEQLELTVDIEKQNGDKKVLGERLVHLTQELKRLEDENTVLMHDVSNATILLESGLDVLVEKEALLEDSRQVVESLRNDFNQVNDQILAKEKEAEDKKNALMQAIEKLAEIKSQMSALLAEKKTLSVMLADLNERIAQEESNCTSGDGNLKELIEQGKECSKTVEDLREVIDSKNHTVKSISERLTVLAQQIEDSLAKFHSAQTKRDILLDMRDAYEGYNNTIKNLMRDAKTKPELSSKIEGLVAQVISVKPEFETAIDTVLGASAQNIITKNEDDAKYILSYLKMADYGRATCLPMTSFKPRNLNQYKTLFTDKGIYGVASDVVKYDAKYQSIVLGLLGGTVVCDNMDTAVRLAKRSGYSFQIVTLDGDVISPRGSLSGGSKKKNVTNLFSHDKELAEANALVESLSIAGKKFIAERNELISKRDGILKDLEDQKRQLHENEVKLAKLEESISKLSEIADGRQRTLFALMKEREERQSRYDAIVSDIDSVSELEATINSAKVNASQDDKESKELFESLKKQRDEYSAKLTEERLKCATLSTQVESAKADTDRLKNNINSSKARIETNQVKIEEDKLTIEDINERLNYVGKNDQTEALKRIDEIKLQLADFDKYKFELNVNLAKIDEQRQSLATELNGLQEKKTQEEILIARVDADLDVMRQRILEEYHLEYEDCLPFKIENYNVEEGVAESNKLKRQISHLGNINVDAIEQSKEVTKEYEDLTTQKEDLEKAAEDAELIIKSMTEEMLTTFNTEFEKIRVNFIKIFKDLFNGGEANLEILDDAEDPLEAGIEILATPPGKDIKAKSIQLLSGGEQSLTAIAILFAILKLKAMPFCVLDEIDSALDDANAGRFAKYLNRFSKDTQFIVITHRKPTMEIADTLYGVTMEEPGVSKIVSVKLADAVDMAQSEQKKAK